MAERQGRQCADSAAFPVNPPDARVNVAVDAGGLVTKVASAGASTLAEPRFRIEATDSRSQRDTLSAVLAEAGHGSGHASTGGRIYLAVPDTWLDGSEEGGRSHEACRHVVEDELCLAGSIYWIGQLAAVAALASSQRGFTDHGHYLVCDIGGRGVRVAVCEVAGRTVRPLAVHDTPGGGWDDFDAAVRAALSADADPGLSGWYRSAISQERRAKLVLARAKENPEFRSARAYLLTGADGTYELSAGQAADCFAPMADRIRAGVASVLGTPDIAAPVVAVLTGGLAWFPEAARTVADATRVAPVVLGPEAAAHGALLIAAQEASLAPHGLPSVAMPMHQIRDGLLEEVSLPIPWTVPFAPPGDDSLTLDSPELKLDVGGRLMVARLPGLVPGRYRIGVRPTWRGSGLLVVRPDQAAAGSDVHVISLDALETA
jgi:hypothetical protein